MPRTLMALWRGADRLFSLTPSDLNDLQPVAFESSLFQWQLATPKRQGWGFIVQRFFEAGTRPESLWYFRSLTSLLFLEPTHTGEETRDCGEMHAWGNFSLWWEWGSDVGFSVWLFYVTKKLAMRAEKARMNTYNTHIRKIIIILTMRIQIIHV